MLPVPNKPYFMVSVDVKHHERRKRLSRVRGYTELAESKIEKRCFFCHKYLQNNQMKPDNVDISSCIFYLFMP